MPFIPPGHAQLNNVMSLSGDSEELITTMGIAFTEIVVTDLQDIVNAAFDAFAGEFKNVLPNSYTFIRTDMYAAFGGDRLVFSSTSAPVVALGSSPSTPQNCAYLMKKGTGVGGRAGRGRMFIPGVTEDAVNQAGVVDPGRVTAMNTRGANYLAALNAIEGIDYPALLHAANIPVPHEILALTCDGRIATQRRRLR